MTSEQRRRLRELVELELDGLLDESSAKELCELMNLEDAEFVDQHG